VVLLCARTSLDYDSGHAHENTFESDVFANSIVLTSKGY